MKIGLYFGTTSGELWIGRDGGELLRLIELTGLGENSGSVRPEDIAPREPAAAPVLEDSPASDSAAVPEPVREPDPEDRSVEPAAIISEPTAAPTPSTTPPMAIIGAVITMFSIVTSICCTWDVSFVVRVMSDAVLNRSNW